jgi:hypothetical protein
LTDNTVKIVITQDVLFELPERSNKYIAFLRYWIALNDTKAVVTLSAWKEFEKHWNKRLKGESQELTESFFANMRGLITPYRTKYATEAQLQVNSEKESMGIDEETIVEWHYATVKYLITKDPTRFHAKIGRIKIPIEFILSPRGLFGKLEVEDGIIIDQFNNEFND